MAAAVTITSNSAQTATPCKAAMRRRAVPASVAALHPAPISAGSGNSMGQRPPGAGRAPATPRHRSNSGTINATPISPPTSIAPQDRPSPCDTGSAPIRLPRVVGIFRRVWLIMRSCAAVSH